MKDVSAFAQCMLQGSLCLLAVALLMLVHIVCLPNKQLLVLPMLFEPNQHNQPPHAAVRAMAYDNQDFGQPTHRRLLRESRLAHMLRINTTTWGPHTDMSMTSRTFPAGAVCISEHMQPTAQVAQMQKQLARGNWRSAVAPAVPGLGLGFSSGT